MNLAGAMGRAESAVGVTDGAAPALALRGVSKRFGAVRALDGISLSVRAGERVAFTGSNGSGKTTLLRCAIGLLRCDGEVEVEGIDVRRDPERALRNMAYIPQVAPPLDAAVAELVRAACRLRGVAVRRVEELSTALGLDYAEIAKKRLRDLSGGSKQKILAAVALAADAQILVADEPTASLDTAARHVFFSLVAARPRDSILVLCSHRTGEVRQLVDRVVELRDGRIATDAPLVDVVRDRAVCRIEVSASNGAAAALHSLGFVAVTEDLWQRACTPAEKLDLLSRLLERRDEIDDVRVLDVDSWQVRS